MPATTLRRLVAATVIVLALLAALAGWAMRDSLGANSDLSTTWNGVLGVLGGAFPVALGALLGAAGALIVAIVNREESRRKRFSTNALSLAIDVIVQADIHARQVRALIAWLEEWVLGESRGEPPKIDDTQPVRQAYLALGLMDKGLGTKGEGVYKALIAIDNHTEPLRLDPMAVYPGWDDDKYRLLLDDYMKSMDAFSDEWRSRPS